jgi:hypothetical protein
MATRYKVLGQVAPSATTATTLYTVPALTDAIISTLVVANRDASASTYRIAIRPNAETLASKHYIGYDVSLSGNDSTTITLGITLDAADVIEVYASTANLSFSAFGTEIDL